MHASAQRLSRRSGGRGCFLETRCDFRYAVPREPSPTHQRTIASIAITPTVLQPKLMVGEVDDRPSTRPTRLPRVSCACAAPIAPVSPMPLGVHRKCAACEERNCRVRRSRDPLRSKRQRRASIVHGRAARAGAAPGRRDTAIFRGALRHDFGTLRVPTDASAAASARAVNARAYTVGAHVVSRPAGRRRLDGRWLLADELAHVIQQQGAR